MLSLFSVSLNLPSSWMNSLTSSIILFMIINVANTSPGKLLKMRIGFSGSLAQLPVCISEKASADVHGWGPHLEFGGSRTSRKYQRCPNYWFKYKRWPLSRNQYAFSFKFRLGEFVWQPGKAEGCCVWRNEARYLQTKTGVNVHRCVPMAFWGCLKSKEQEAREENAVTCCMQMKHRHTLYLSVAGTTSYNTVFWTASSFTLMLWFRASWRRNRL